MTVIIPDHRNRPAGRVTSYVARQFRNPQGPLGAVAGRIMASRSSNLARNRHLVELLELEPASRVLEIGPGPGVALALAAEVVTEGELVAIDHSERMLAQTASRNHRTLAQGRLTLLEGRGEEVPASLGLFDRIYSMNVWHFWDDQERTIARLAERLAPGGRLVVGYQPRSRGATAADSDAARRCLCDQLRDAGLVVTADVLDLVPPAVYVEGRRDG